MAVAANYSGSPEPGAITVQASKGNAGITKGDVLTLSSNKWITGATSGVGPFAVALETKAASATTIRVMLQGIAYVISDGTINPNARVAMSASTAGQVIAYVATTLPAGGSVTGTDVASARDEHNRIVGVYLGKENEADGSTEASAAADGDTIRVWLGPRS